MAGGGKRAASESAGNKAKSAKVEKEQSEPEKSLAPLIEKLQPIQNKLAEIDSECLQEQTKIQQKFEQKKLPLLKERDELLKEEDGFWAAALTANPFMNQYLPEPELDFLQKHLKSIHVNDHLDDNGSYQVTFEFKPSAQETFSPITLTKKVVFDEDESIKEEETTVTQITFKDETKDFRKLLAKTQTKQDDHNTNCACEDCGEPEEYSLFTWFSEKNLEDVPFLSDFGELIRRQIYPSPLLMLEGDDSSEDDDSDGADQDQ